MTLSTQDIIAVGRAAREAGARRAAEANPAVAEAVRRQCAAEADALRRENAALREEVAALRERVKRRVAARKGLARLALGFCMHDLAVRTGLGAADAPGRVTLTARTAAKADIIETGFSSGETAVRIADRLRYAAKALKGGRAAIAEALDAALNKTRGLIVSRLKKDGRMEDAIAVKGMF